MTYFQQNKVLKFYAPHYKSDAEWFANGTYIPARGRGAARFETRNETWPRGQWLDKPL